MNTLNNSGRTLNSFEGFLHRTEELKHSYQKFRFEGEVSKPDFDEMYKDVKYFIKEILPE